MSNTYGRAFEASQQQLELQKWISLQTSAVVGVASSNIWTHAALAGTIVGITAPAMIYTQDLPPQPEGVPTPLRRAQATKFGAHDDMRPPGVNTESLEATSLTAYNGADFQDLRNEDLFLDLADYQALTARPKRA